MARSPRVSVVLIGYNDARFLQAAIDSVLAQRFTDWELILVDDGSTDDSPAIARQACAQHPQQIRYLEHAGHANRGAAASRNLGIEHASGEFIAFLDSDDVWLPDKLSDQVALLEQHPEVGMVAGVHTRWESWAGKPDWTPPLGVPLDTPLPAPGAVWRCYPLGRGRSPCPSDVLLRASVARAVGGFEPEFVGPLQLNEDQAFFSKVYLTTTVWFARRTWTLYRMHPAQCCQRHADRYFEVRLYLLHWLERYWRRRQVTRPLLWLRLYTALCHARWNLFKRHLRLRLRRVVEGR
jgi:glycosyltransferase involved in cell wall biosynthesis